MVDRITSGYSDGEPRDSVHNLPVARRRNINISASPPTTDVMIDDENGKRVGILIITCSELKNI